jgi:transcriptional regulator with XRE-family HTH domain
MLGTQLRRFREAADVSAETAGWRIGASRSKISRMEKGRVGFKERDVSDLLGLYGVTDPRVLAGLLELATQANAQAWWAKFGDVLPGWFEPYLGLEASASRIRTFDLQFINGLFQTEAYARAVTRIGLRGAASTGSASPTFRTWCTSSSSPAPCTWESGPMPTITATSSTRSARRR